MGASAAVQRRKESDMETEGTHQPPEANRNSLSGRKVGVGRRRRSWKSEGPWESWNWVDGGAGASWDSSFW